MNTSGLPFQKQQAGGSPVLNPKVCGINTNSCAVPERGGAAPGTARDLSNAHIRSQLCTSKQFAQVEVWRGGSLVHCQRKAEFLVAGGGNKERFAAFPVIRGVA